MENQQLNYLKTMQIIFSALLTGQALAMIIFYVFLSRPPKDDYSMDIVEIVLPLVMISTTVLGYFLFNMRRKTWVEETNLDTKKGVYRTASIVKWAMFEGTTLLSLACYLIFSKDLYLFVAIVFMAHFTIHFPSRERVVRELETDNIEG